MAQMECPKCGAKIPTQDGWAKAALSSTIAAPAATDMATQVRCPSCRALFAQSDIIYTGASASLRFRTIAWVGAFAAISWAIYRFVVR